MTPQLHILPLGTGNALVNDPGNFHSNFLVHYGESPGYHPERTLFVDCGSDFQRALDTAGIHPTDVHHMYISHLHADHVGGLEWLTLAKKYTYHQKPMTLFIPKDIEDDLTTKMSISLAANFEDMRRNGLGACYNVHARYATGSNYFFVDQIRCSIIEVPHISDAEDMKSFALFMKAKNSSVLITTDARYCPDILMPYYEKAGVILQDCSTSKEDNLAHANFSQLIALPLAIKEKMFLYHYGPGEKPEATQFGFRGYAQPREWITA